MEIVWAQNGDFYYSIRGQAEGTVYHLIYKDEQDRDFQKEIERLLKDFEKSFSVYDPDSVVSRINRNEGPDVDDRFSTVFRKAEKIARQTGGAFDITAEPLFRIWGFSSEEKKTCIASTDIEKQLLYVGMDKVRLDGTKVVKSDPNIVMNFNAIAKGYSADLVADFLENQGCRDYLVEIGGELRLNGKSSTGNDWLVGIDQPSDERFLPGQRLQSVLQLTGKGIATSGNYRRFYMENGKKIAHTIDPRTGYPVSHNLLSVTVVAEDAMTADAFATAFLVVGLDEALAKAGSLPEMEALFIYDENMENKICCTPGMYKYVRTDWP